MAAADWAEALGRAGTFSAAGQIVGQYGNLYQDMVMRRAEALRKAREDEMQAKLREMQFQAAERKAAEDAKRAENERKFMEKVKLGKMKQTGETPAAPVTPGAPAPEPQYEPYSWQEQAQMAAEMGIMPPQEFVKITEPPRPASPSNTWDPILKQKFDTEFGQHPRVKELEKIAFTDVARAPEAINELNVIGRQMGLTGQQFFEGYIGNLKGRPLLPTAPPSEYKVGQDVYDRVQKYADKNADLIDATQALIDVDEELKTIGLGEGIWDNNIARLDIPGIGTGAAAFRRYAQDKMAVNLRQSVENLALIVRNAYFGASLTEGEKEAFNDFIGRGFMSNETAFLSAMRKVANRLAARMKPIGGSSVRAAAKEEGLLMDEDVPGYGTHIRPRGRQASGGGGGGSSQPTETVVEWITDPKTGQLRPK